MSQRTVDWWVIEFLLRQPFPEDPLKQLIYSLPLPSPFPSRLRRTFLLRRLNSDLSADVSPDTDTLHFLKLLLDGDLGASPSCYESVAAAYRAVTLHGVAVAFSASDGGSTFRTLVAELCTNVGDLEVAEPALPTLRKLLIELEALLTAPLGIGGATSVLFSEDTATAALNAIGACLTASFEDLGPCFLEKLVEIVEKKEIIFGEPSRRDFGNADLGDGERNFSSASQEKEMENDVVPNDKLDAIPTPEYKKESDALKKSCPDLKRVVEDPLHDAIKVAAEVSKSQPSLVAKDEVPKRSLMDRNPSARTYQWGDDSKPSSDKSSPSSNPIISQPDMHTRKAPMDSKMKLRRKKKKWTAAEEDVLRAGVQRYGRGNWKLILNSHLDVFDGRSEVDLKDKWRNMSRH